MKDCIASHDESSGIQIFYNQKQTDCLRKSNQRHSKIRKASSFAGHFLPEISKLSDFR